MTRLELHLNKLQQLKRTRHQLIDWSTTISNNIDQNQAEINSTIRTIQSLQQEPVSLTKYETVVKAIEGNPNALELRPTATEPLYSYSQEELQAIDYHLHNLKTTIAPDPQLHL